MPVQIFDNFLDEKFCDECLETALNIFGSGSNQLWCNQNFWDGKIVRDSFPVLGHNINVNTKIFANLKSKIEQKTEKKILNREGAIMFYYWTTNSYIPWHDDGHYSGGFTIYLNDYWDRDWGGIFLYKEESDQSIRGIIPKKNRAVFQSDRMLHTTTPVTFDGKLRVSIQTFVQ